MGRTGRTALIVTAGLFLVGLVFVVGFVLGNTQTADEPPADQSSKEGDSPPQSEKTGVPKSGSEGKANQGPERLTLGETYTSPANGVSITVLNPERLDESPLGKAKNAKTGEPIPVLPSLGPSESVLVFDITISNGGSNPVDIQQNSFTLEDQNGNRFDQVINSQIVGSSSNNFGQFLPGQERVSRAAFEAPRDATDLLVSFRPQNALVAQWEIPSVAEIPMPDQTTNTKG